MIFFHIFDKLIGWEYVIHLMYGVHEEPVSPHLQVHPVTYRTYQTIFIWLQWHWIVDELSMFYSTVNYSTLRLVVAGWRHRPSTKSMSTTRRKTPYSDAIIRVRRYLHDFIPSEKIGQSYEDVKMSLTVYFQLISVISF